MDPEACSVYEFGNFRLDPRRRLLQRIEGEQLRLSSTAFQALVYLIEHAGELVPRTVLLQVVWPSTIVEDNNISKAISMLRGVIGHDSIVTVPRRGYQFVADVRRVPPRRTPFSALSDLGAPPLPSTVAAHNGPPGSIAATRLLAAPHPSSPEPSTSGTSVPSPENAIFQHALPAPGSLRISAVLLIALMILAAALAGAAAWHAVQPDSILPPSRIAFGPASSPP